MTTSSDASISFGRGRAAALLALAAVAASCASAGGPPASVNGLGIAGVWRFDVVLEESIRGTVTFTGDDRYVVRCIDDLTHPPPPALLTRRAGALEFRACGALFRVRDDGEGRIVADVSREVREPYTAQGPCVETRTYSDGSTRCVRYEDVIRYRTRTVRTRIELQPVVRTAAVPQLVRPPQMP